MEVLEDLRDSGINAYQNVTPNQFIESNGLKTVKGRIYPLGGISNITTIFGNESGYYPVIETDEHGFNNPKGLYEINKVDIVLTGDSFTEGYSVHSDETISAVIRKSGFNAMSIGKAGNGPLLELAALKEYAEPLKPKIVLWLYYVNDSGDLAGEIGSPILLKYLTKNDFSQNLISRQEEIDSLLVDYVQGEWVKSRERKSWCDHWVFKIAKLSVLRKRINLISTPTPTPTSPPKPKPKPIFKDIMQKANHMVSGWGGKMYFVYLPSYFSYSETPYSVLSVADSFTYANEELNREFVLHTTNEREIPIIDIHKEVFVPHSDPLSLYPFRMDGHFNAEGYRLVAKSISNILKADGIIPLNSKN